MQNSYIKANHHPIPSGDFTLCYKEKPKNGIDFNYVWYSGKLWRIVAKYSDGIVLA